MCVLSTFPGQRQLAEEAASTKAEPPSLKSATSLDHAAEEARCTAAVAEVVKAAHRPSNFAVAIQNLCLGSRGAHWVQWVMVHARSVLVCASALRHCSG